MPAWWERFPGRLETELRAFRDLGLEFVLDDAAFTTGCVRIRGALDVAGHGRVEIVVAYPDTFPDTRVTVYAPGLDLRRHQNPFERNLCILPRGSDYWRPSQLAAPLVAAAVPELLTLLAAGDDAVRAAEDPQGEPFSDYYHYWPLGGVLVPGAALSLAVGEQRGTFVVRLRSDARWIESLLGDPTSGPIGQALLVTVNDIRGELMASADAEVARGFTGREWSGRWLRTQEPIRAPDGPDFAARLTQELPDLRKPRCDFRMDHGHFEIVGVVYPEEVRQGVFEDAWVFLVIGQAARRREYRATLLRGMRATIEDCGARIPELKSLRESRVAIAGVGALGSSVARELCRNLIGELRVLDSDYVDAGSTVRWLEGIAAAGPLKVLAVKQILERAYPYTAIDVTQQPVGVAPIQVLGPSEAENLEKWIAGTNLVLEATAEDNVSRAVATLARARNLPQLYLWSIEGYGGVVARILPGRTGCYHCLTLAVSPDGGSILLPAPPRGREQRRVQPRGCADPTLAASAADLEPLATQAVRVAFGLLSEGVPGGYPMFEHDVFVLTQRLPDGTPTSPPRWEAYFLPPDPRCPLCNPPPVR